jgi:hypothetical protein
LEPEETILTNKHIPRAKNTHLFFFLEIPFYLQSVLEHAANCVKTYIVAHRRVLSSAPLFSDLLYSRLLVAFGNRYTCNNRISVEVFYVICLVSYILYIVKGKFQFRNLRIWLWKSVALTM